MDAGFGRAIASSSQGLTTFEAAHCHSSGGQGTITNREFTQAEHLLMVVCLVFCSQSLHSIIRIVAEKVSCFSTKFLLKKYVLPCSMPVFKCWHNHLKHNMSVHLISNWP